MNAESLAAPVPYDPEAETVVCGSLAIHNPGIPAARRRLAPGDFHGPLMRRVFGAILRLHDRKEPAEYVSICRELERDGELSREERLRITQMGDGVPKAASIEHHIDSILEKAIKRRTGEAASALAAASLNGADLEDIDALIGDVVKAGQRQHTVTAHDLYASDVKVTAPEYHVRGLFRRRGTHMVWAKGGSGKTWGLLNWSHQMLMEEPPEFLCGHPDLAINRPWESVIWIGTEEDTGTLRSKADMVLRGLGVKRLRGTLKHVWASDPRRQVTLEDIEEILDGEGGRADAVICDSLTGLLPKVVEGKRPAWDLDNFLVNEYALRLRGLASERDVAFFLVHHSGTQEHRHRGPSEWLNSADQVFGLTGEDGRVKVALDKSRDAEQVPPFYLTRSWDADGFHFNYQGAAPRSTLTPAAARCDEFLKLVGRASQAAIVKETDLDRETVRAAARACCAAGLWTDTGVKAGVSPVYQHSTYAEVPSAG